MNEKHLRRKRELIRQVISIPALASITTFLVGFVTVSTNYMIGGLAMFVVVSQFTKWLVEDINAKLNEEGLGGSNEITFIGMVNFSTRLLIAIGFVTYLGITDFSLSELLIISIIVSVVVYGARYIYSRWISEKIPTTTEKPDEWNEDDERMKNMRPWDL